MSTWLISTSSAILPPLVHRLCLCFLAQYPHIFIGFVRVLNTDNRVHMVDAMRGIEDTHLCRRDRNRCLPAYLERDRDIPELFTEGERTRNTARSGLRIVAHFRIAGIDRLPA